MRRSSEARASRSSRSGPSCSRTNVTISTDDRSPKSRSTIEPRRASCQARGALVRAGGCGADDAIETGAERLPRVGRAPEGEHEFIGGDAAALEDAAQLGGRAFQLT